MVSCVSLAVLWGWCNQHYSKHLVLTPLYLNFMGTYHIFPAMQLLPPPAVFSNLKYVAKQRNFRYSLSCRTRYFLYKVVGYDYGWMKYFFIILY